MPERVEAILRRYGVAERDIGACCDDLSPHMRPPGAPLGPRYTETRPESDPALAALKETWPAFQREDIDTERLDTNMVREGWPKPTIYREHEIIHVLLNVIDHLRRDRPERSAENDAPVSVEDRIFAVIVGHQRIPTYSLPGANRCSGCGHLLGESDGPNSPRHARHVAELITSVLSVIPPGTGGADA